MAQPAIAADAVLEGKVEAQMAKMSLRDKLGQMVELDLRGIMTKDVKGKFIIDLHKLDSLLVNFRVGSFLNTPGPQGVPAAEWGGYIKQIQDVSIKHLGIPTVFGVDENHGVTYTTDGTLMPQNINVGATFNREIARRAAEVTAYETRAFPCLGHTPQQWISRVMHVGLAVGRTSERIVSLMLRWVRL